jgi:hypothetical protein
VVFGCGVTSGDAFGVGIIGEDDHAHVGLQAYLAEFDLYYLHSAGAADIPFEDQVGTLAELRQQSVIRHIGLSNVTGGQFRAAQQITDIAAVTAHYNIGDRTGAGLLAAAGGRVYITWSAPELPCQTSRPVRSGWCRRSASLMTTLPRHTSHRGIHVVVKQEPH